MPASLSARQVTVHHGAALVLDAVDLRLHPGDRLGVVGPNGVGKSTLLRVLAGEIVPESGGVSASPPTATVGYLPQEPERSSTETVEAFLRRRTGVAAADAALAVSTDELAAAAAGADDRYTAALERWLGLGAADFDVRVGEVWDELGLDPVLVGQSMASLSGGQAARVMLASLFLSRFDVLLLDEPTNDVDLDGLDRLERWLRGLDRPVALVSHDRALLAEVVTGVIDIDQHTHRATRFEGGWESYLAELELERRHAQQRWDEYSSKRQALVDRRQRQREWATQGAAKLRRSSENDKNIRAYRLDQTEQLAGKSARTDRAIERLDRNDSVPEPRRTWELRLEIPTTTRSGDVVATMRGVEVARGERFRLGPLDLSIARGDRIALLGANGSGKSTLIDAMLGRLPLDAGEASLGPSVVPGEMAQARTSIVGPDGLLDAFTSATGWSDVEARTLLAKFGLGATRLGRPGATLSPGERTRAGLALLMARGANFLVLDEPTNHLDLEAIEQLESALSSFGETVLLVTHDRALLERVELTRRLELVDGHLVEH